MIESVQVLFSRSRFDWQGDKRHVKATHRFEPGRHRHRSVHSIGRRPSSSENPMHQRQVNSALWASPGSRRPRNPLLGPFAGAFRFRVRSFLLSMALQQSHHAPIIPAPFEPTQLGRPPRHSYTAHSASFASLCRQGRRESPFFIIDSHPVDVCRPIRAGKKKRLGGLAKTGYCSSLKRWFHGVREHLIFTPQGRIAFTLQIAGNRHDVNGLYALLKSSFHGHLFGDNAYWPKAKNAPSLSRKESPSPLTHAATGILKIPRKNRNFWMPGVVRWNGASDFSMYSFMRGERFAAP